MCHVLGVTQRTPLRDHLTGAVHDKVTEGVTVRTERVTRTGLHGDCVGLRAAIRTVAAVAHHRAVHGSEGRGEWYTGIEQRYCGGVDARRQQLASRVSTPRGRMQQHKGGTYRGTTVLQYLNNNVDLSARMQGQQYLTFEGIEDELLQKL
jgi:hypothetical protein